MGCSSIGIVIRDSNGKFVLDLSRIIIGVLKAEHIEAMTASFAVRLASEWGYAKLILGVSKGIIDALREDTGDFSEAGLFMDQIKDCSGRFNEFFVSWIRWSGMKVLTN